VVTNLVGYTECTSQKKSVDILYGLRNNCLSRVGADIFLKIKKKRPDYSPKLRAEAIR
jgi:hypothetical protein